MNGISEYCSFQDKTSNLLQRRIWEHSRTRQNGQATTSVVCVMSLLRVHTFAGIATLLCPRRADRSVTTAAEHFNIVAHAIVDANI